MKTCSLIAALGALSSVAFAQSYRELTTLRSRPSPWASVLSVRAGVLGALADNKEPTIGRENELGWDGDVYYHNDRFGNKEAMFDAYVGRDGAYLGMQEGGLLGGEAQSRLEISARYFPFYREGFYRSGDFVPTGQFEGSDWGVSLSVAQMAAEDLRLELGPYYRRMNFNSNGDTQPNFVLPDNFNVIGGRATLEQTTLAFDRYGWRPRTGFLFNVTGEYEQNDSSKLFGTTGVYESELPKRLWRARAHIEFYVPQADALTWTVRADGSLSDDQDRIYAADAQKPVGYAWVDGRLGLRIDLGQAFSLTPFLSGQYIRILQENGIGTDAKTFFGGGADLAIDLGDNLSLLAWYSYLANQSREPVRTTKDTLGEHRFFAGMEVRFGAARR